jgi:hypothetical protein
MTSLTAEIAGHGRGVRHRARHRGRDAHRRG